VSRDERGKKIVVGLKKLYPDAACELNYSNPLELLLATILSAQCTDVRVNATTKKMFERYKTAEDYARANPAELEGIIRSCGFYRMKAKSIIETSRIISEKFGGRVPDRMEDLLTLRGVARKTANVVLGNAYHKAEGVVVDTHMKRLAWRMGLTDEQDPVKVERDLMESIPRKDWIFFSHAMILHGRRLCKAHRADCDSCLLRVHCAQKGLDAD
jgi:endonuclease-3